MKVHILSSINDILTKRFESLCETEEALAPVKLKRENGWKSYSLFDYSKYHSAFVRAVDDRMKAENVGDVNGVFTRKHSPALLAKIQEIANDVGAGDIVNCQNRFETMWDRAGFGG